MVYPTKDPGAPLIKAPINRVVEPGDFRNDRLAPLVSSAERLANARRSNGQLYRVEGVLFPGEAGYREKPLDCHERLEPMNTEREATGPSLRFQLKLGPDAVLTSCLIDHMGKQKATDFVRQRLQKISTRKLTNEEFISKLEKVKLIPLDPPTVCIAARDLRQFNTVRCDANFVQHGIKICERGNASEWNHVGHALRSIRQNWNAQNSSALVGVYANLIKSGKLISWSTAFPGMKLHQVAPSFAEEVGSSGVIVRQAGNSESLSNAQEPIGTPHIDAEPIWLHHNALTSIRKANNEPFHMFITFNIWVALGQPAENQTLAVRAWNPWAPSALHEFLHDGGAALDMREPEHYYGLSKPTPHEFIIMMQHTSLRPGYEGVTHFGATLLDNQDKPLPAKHPRESCEARMVVSFKVKGEVTQRPCTGEWGCYQYVWGQIFYANDKSQQTAWMPDDKRYFIKLSDSEFEAVRNQLTHKARSSPISYSRFKAELSCRRVSTIY